MRWSHRCRSSTSVARPGGCSTAVFALLPAHQPFATLTVDVVTLLNREQHWIQTPNA
ncbi:hypothetical protein PR003_g12947 [Phytophthora rubi]|uniref:Uncharacterized protein n=1 Tax=Phytophthora rubi TaxID=129364 RepID=A0A6A4FGV6_9STRA|nr:hypothetical protein PR001_g12209 [Phytophthora rubi]KAE9335566.1 hypothetical protein PR003_g12947 [Phytophthora rubi]